MSARPVRKPPGLRWLAALAWAALVFLLMAPDAVRAAALKVEIDLSAQEMHIQLDGRTLHAWPVSTGRPGYGTPTGSYAPIRLEAKWYSRKYNNAPMPHSIFFRGGYAIHGTTEISSLGRPASHGCVRLHPDNARILFDLVRRHGFSGTRISIRR